MNQKKAAERDQNFVWIDEPSSLQEMIAHLWTVPAISVDTESDSLYVYYEKVCLVQFSTLDTDYLVDPLNVDIRPLGELFASQQHQKIFHAAEYDVLCLKRDYGFTFVNLFDTMIAARLLGWRRYGLGSILEDHFDVKLNKRMQRFDWGTRPLPTSALEYARFDTHYLLALRDIQLEEIKEKGRLEEAYQAFQRTTRVEPTSKEFDPNAFWRIKGARDLEPRQQAVLKEVFLFRDELARQLDKPPFKIMGNSAMLTLAQLAPTTHKSLNRVKGLSYRVRSQRADDLLQAIERGLQARPPAYPRNNHHRIDSQVEANYQALRSWRNDLAEVRNVEPDVILTNQVLMDVAQQSPKSPRALAEVDSLDDWQRATYGDALLHVLKTTKN